MAGAAAAGGAGGEDERVAEQAAERVAVAAGDRGGDEAVDRALEQRDLPAGLGAQRVRVPVAPVRVDQRAVAQVADARAAPAQEPGERVSGMACSPAASACTPWASGAPVCGVPSETTWRTRRVQAAPRNAPWWQAERATSPPIECPTSAMSSHSGSPSGSASSDAPLSDTWRPVL